MKNTKKIFTPYLLIYKPQIGSILSIMERITGLVLFFVICLKIFIEEIGVYGIYNYNTYKIEFFFIKIQNYLS